MRVRWFIESLDGASGGGLCPISRLPVGGLYPYSWDYMVDWWLWIVIYARIILFGWNDALKSRITIHRNVCCMGKYLRSLRLYTSKKAIIKSKKKSGGEKYDTNIIKAQIQRERKAVGSLPLSLCYSLQLVTEMILFHFILHLIALSSLFRIAISFTVNSDCGDLVSNVTSWVEEARFLYDRAGKVLGSPLTPNIRNILRACLGTSATVDDFKGIQGQSYCHVLNLTAYIKLMMDYSLYK